jgi:hypothetical protein
MNNENIDGVIVVPSVRGTNEARGAALKTAYEFAKKGRFDHDCERTTVVVPPGKYDVGEDGLVLDAPKVDVVAMVEAAVANAGRRTMKLEPTVTIYGAGQGVVRLVADDIHLRDLEIVAGRKGSIGLTPYAYGNRTILQRCLINAVDGRATAVGQSYRMALDACAIIGDYALGGSPSDAEGMERVGFYGTLNRCLILGRAAVGGNGWMEGDIYSSYIDGDYALGGGGRVNGKIYDSVVDGYNCVAGGRGEIGPDTRVERTSITGDGALGAEEVNNSAIFRYVRWVPKWLPKFGGTYRFCEWCDE